MVLAGNGLIMGKKTKKRMKNEKNLRYMFHVVPGDISDERLLKDVSRNTHRKKKVQIDAIVNAAKPTLMGSGQGVDGAIHSKIDAFFGEKGEFNKRICEELGQQSGENGSRVRCQRGQAVITKGYNLSKYIIHVVGSLYDGQYGWKKHLFSCSSSRIRTLESCYREIIRTARAHPDIKNIAVPIIGAGEYGFPFEMAVKIAVTALGNALLEWKREDREYFDDRKEGLQNIFLFVWDNSPDEAVIDEKVKTVKKVLRKYRKIFGQGRQAVPHNSFQAQQQYFFEIFRYDKDRGYFCIAWLIRLILAVLRFLSGYTYLKDIFGGKNWQRRRMWVEITVVLKIVTASLIGFYLFRGGNFGNVIRFLLYYNLIDTVTYLISLILMADIQKPSANVIRSMLLLLLNYVEVSLEMSCLYFQQYKADHMTFLQALGPGFIGEMPDGFAIESFADHMLHFGNTALKFFFITMAFGYFAGHLRQRTFRR
jgi:O-acetyl-ADP-ribose deacetylase (regulator of RNase III)